MIRFRTHLVTIAPMLFAAMLPSTARASGEVHIRVHHYDGSTEPYDRDSGEAIDVLDNVTNTVDWINIYTDNSSLYDIGPVTLSGGATQAVRVVIGAGTFGGGHTSFTAAARNWAGMTATGGLQQYIALEGRIAGNLTGSVLVGNVYRFDVDGTVSSGGIGANASNGGFFEIHCGSTASNGPLVSAASVFGVTATGDIAGAITASAGNIGDIVVSGSLTGDIMADGSPTASPTQGSISSVTVTGNIGSSGSPVSITATHVISKITCAAAWADVSTGSPNQYGEVHRVVTTSGGFHGSIVTDHMEYGTGGTVSGFSIAGDLDADVTFARYAGAQSLSIAGAIPTGRTLSIGQSFGTSGSPTARTISVGTLAGTLEILPDPTHSPPDHGNLWGNLTIGSGGLSGLLSISGSLTSTISIPANKLSGQIIINAGDSGDSWSGSVVVGSTTLSPTPDYTNTPASIGGGAVGLAPFDLHDAGCDPVNGGHANDWTSSATLTFYGPVTWSSMPVEVYSRVGTGSWTKITSNFSVLSPTGGRNLVLVPYTSIPGTPTTNYKVVPVPGAIKCLDVTGSPAVDFEYDLLN
jgi:hypothetical protein